MSIIVELLKASEGVERKIPVIDLEGSKIGEASLPKVFYAPLRIDLVSRAFIHLQTHSLQPKGAFKGSGHKYSVDSWGAGYGMARISRINASGTGKAQAGGMVPSAVGGRPTHPPTPEKKIHKELNKKEKKIALITAVAFTGATRAVIERGHRVPENISLPIVVDGKIESVAKTKELVRFLEKIGLREELERCREKKIRAGKGKRRGRRYKKRVGPLIVVLEDVGISDAARNIPGVDVVKLKDLSVLHLAPGAKPGRLTIYSVNAFQKIDELLLGGLG
ncbi:MAG: 50S ribosomal protein L4 [Nitrososphaerota archaeon]